MWEGSPDRLIRRRKGCLVVGAAIGTGMAANFAMRGGADFLLALNAGRLRSMGEPSVASMLALNEANRFVMDFAATEILPRATVPVIFGACCFDPRQDIAELVERVRAAGFHGIANFPTAGMLAGPLRDRLEEAGLGCGRERAMLRRAREAGLVSIAYAHSLQEAEAATGADIVVIGLGWNQGGALGRAAGDGGRAIEEAAIHVGRAARIVGQSGALCLVEGGPIVSPRHLEELCGFVNIDGYVGGSTIDRVPIEAAIEDTTSGFKTVEVASAARSDSGRMHTFPVQLAGRSDKIRTAREMLMRLAAGEGPVQLLVPDPAGAGPVAETLHRLSRERHREPVVVSLDAGSGEAARVELFGMAASEPGGRDRIGWLEVCRGGTLILECGAGTPASLVRAVTSAVRRGHARRLNSQRGYAVQVRLVVASSPDMPALPGLSRLRIPHLSERPEDVSAVLDQVLRAVRQRLRRPQLRLDAAAWRQLADHPWPGDIDELRDRVERAALITEGCVISSIDLDGALSGNRRQALFASEKDWVLDGLRRNRFHRGKTAAWLGISRKTLYNKMRRYLLDREGARR
jgi:predicted TIM-barrel enzyme/transcriptional regulator with AAA-type ATPase domain